MRPTVAEIDLEALPANYRELEGRVRRGADPSARLLAVVKADAYGHGVVQCGQALAEGAGAAWLGVTSVQEALALEAGLREGGARPRMLVMSGFFPGEEEEVVRRGLRPQVWEPWHLERLHRTAQSLGYPERSVPVHLEVDTGMSRQGVAPDGAAALLRGVLPAESPVFLEGVLTHFSSPEVLTGVSAADPALSSPSVEHQLGLLAEALDGLWEVGLCPQWLHAGNSANAAAGVGLSRLARLADECGARLLVRPGLALYGVPTRFIPASETADAPMLQPVLRWRTAVTSLREVAPGTPVGYNETFRAARRTRLATVPVGYADGLRRELGNRGAMLLRGFRAPMVGRVSMDQTVLDVTDVPGAAIGDEVVILGKQGEAEITAWEHADACGTIPYEILCGIAARVSRIPSRRS